MREPAIELHIVGQTQLGSESVCRILCKCIRAHADLPCLGDMYSSSYRVAAQQYHIARFIKIDSEQAPREFDLRLLDHDVALINRPAVPRCRTASKTIQKGKQQHSAYNYLGYLHDTTTSFLLKRANIAARDATAELVAIRARLGMGGCHDSEGGL